MLHAYMFYPQPVQDTSLNREIHVNLVNAVLTGVSCDDIGCVLPLLHVIFHLSLQAYSTTALPTYTRHLLYRARHGSTPVTLISTYLRYSLFLFNHLQKITVLCLYIRNICFLLQLPVM